MTTEALHDVDLVNITLNGTNLSADITDAVLEAVMERTIDGASTIRLTVFDPERNLINSDLFMHRSVLEIDRLKFVLVQVAKNGENVELTFEDYAISLLRGHTGFLKVYRDEYTRAEFIKKLVREEPSIHFYAPELHTLQPIGKIVPKKHKKSERKPGFGPKSKITIKGVSATPEQLENLQIVLEVGYKMNASQTVLVAAIMTVIDESTAHNHGRIGFDAKPLSYQMHHRGEAASDDNGTSVGLFQQIDGWGPYEERHDPATAARMFFERAIRSAQQNPNFTYSELAQSIQRSRAGHYHYAQWQKEALKIVDKFFGGNLLDINARYVDKIERYEFTRGQPGQPEDSWTAIKRLADQVNWRAFMIGSTLYYTSENWLMATEPHMVLNEHTEGIDNIDFDWDGHKEDAHATITCRASRWVAPPGSVVELDECGVANGRWIVYSIGRSLFDQKTTIELHRKLPKLPEPTPSTTSRKIATARGQGKGGAEGKAAVTWALQWDNMKFIKINGVNVSVYSQEPGISKHGLSLETMMKENLKPPFDCSSFTRIAWAKGGGIDIGENTYAQIAKAISTPGLLIGGTKMGDDGKPPIGGWQAGDLIFPHDGHVALAIGDGKTVISDHNKPIGIKSGPQYKTVYFWARWKPGIGGSNSAQSVFDEPSDDTIRGDTFAEAISPDPELQKFSPGHVKDW